MFYCSNPFKKGEKVKILTTGNVGTVETTPEMWKALQERAEQEDSFEDWSDAGLIIRFEGCTWDHIHICPIYIEHVEDAAYDNSVEIAESDGYTITKTV